jgi:hypothetical protein
MGAADAAGVVTKAGGEDRVPMSAGFGALPGTIFNTAPESFAQPVMELAISSTEPADTPAAPNLVLSESESVLKIQQNCNSINPADNYTSPSPDWNPLGLLGSNPFSVATLTMMSIYSLLTEIACIISLSVFPCCSISSTISSVCRS